MLFLTVPLPDGLAASERHRPEHMDKRSRVRAKCICATTTLLQDYAARQGSGRSGLAVSEERHYRRSCMVIDPPKYRLEPPPIRIRLFGALHSAFWKHSSDGSGTTDRSDTIPQHRQQEQCISSKRLRRIVSTKSPIFWLKPRKSPISLTQATLDTSLSVD